ncbi:MAG: SRPBCC family protein [Deltaproteobacteria bacterium]|nr:SRPBCC family protein [Deltaproteobacteria bacterium]
MRLESQRTLVLPATPDEVWRLLSDPGRLPILAPEIEDAWAVRGGLVRVLARMGRRRRSWRVKLTADEGKRRLELDSATPDVHFHLEATVEPAPEGSRVQVQLMLEPPQVWKPDPQPGGVPRRVVQRLLLSVMLFALSAFGVVELPSLRLAPMPAAIAYALVGAAFVVAAALLSSAHSPRNPRARRPLLPRVPGSTRSDGPPPKTS